MFLIAGIIPVLGDFFIPTALNIGHIAFFAAAQTALSRKDG
jgi:hypothetical protein